MTEAAEIARELAGRHGIGLCVVQRITHVRAAGYYAEMLAARGQIGIVLAASGPIMAYHGVAGAAVSTAPLAIGVPARGERHAPARHGDQRGGAGQAPSGRGGGQAIPADWALDGAGHPTTDPEAATTLLPLGGPKGSGLALMFECLASLLAGAPIFADTLASARGEPVRRAHASWEPVHTSPSRPPWRAVAPARQ